MTKAAPRAAVVVSTHNRVGRLTLLLAALKAQTLSAQDFEVIVVDDGSTDKTADALAAETATGELALKFARNSSSAGAAAARDRGWRLASASVIAFTDDDCEPHPEWLEAGIDALEQARGFVQGRTVPNPRELDKIGPFSRTIAIEKLDLNFNTCNVFYPRALLAQIDGFDTRAFGRGAAGEDSDLAWRAMEAGARPTFAPQALAYHAVNGLGPLGKLRVAARSMDGYARHPALRRATFVHRVFWKREHMLFAGASLGLVIRKLPLPLRLLVALPYARSIWARWRVLGGSPLVILYHPLHDLTEIAAVARSGIRYRQPMI